MLSEHPEAAVRAVRVIGPPRSRPACKNHLDVDAEFRCTKCTAMLCVECARRAEYKGVEVRTCECDGGCEPLATEQELKDRQPFPTALRDAFLWPFQPEARVGLIAGTLVFGFTGLAPSGPTGFNALAIVFVLVGMLLSGYLIDFASDLVLSTAKGRDDLPEWPDFTDVYESMLKPLGTAITLGVATLGPALLVGVLSGFAPFVFAPILFLGIALFGLAFAAVAIGGLDGGTPSAVAALLRSVPSPAALATLALGGIGLVTWGVKILASYIPFLGAFLGAFAMLSAVIASARILGLVLREHIARTALTSPS